MTAVLPSGRQSAPMTTGGVAGAGAPDAAVGAVVVVGGAVEVVAGAAERAVDDGVGAAARALVVGAVELEDGRGHRNAQQHREHGHDGDQRG